VAGKSWRAASMFGNREDCSAGTGHVCMTGVQALALKGLDQWRSDKSLGPDNSVYVKGRGARRWRGGREPRQIALFPFMASAVMVRPNWRRWTPTGND
jgi:hypothetical protein